jgi:hypothetical protein
MSAYTEKDSYNGWANYETWNVALWISNDEGLYSLAKACRKSKSPYGSFRTDLRDVWGDESIGQQTPDGVSWFDSKLDIEALNELVQSL